MNNKGFISSVLLYTMLILFLFFMLSIINYYEEKNIYLESIDEQIDYDLKDKLNVELYEEPSSLAAIIKEKNKENKDDETYYYIGDADNHLIFNNMCWRIISETDNKIKLIYNGTPSGGQCTGEIDLETTNFNEFSDSKRYVGYTYVNFKKELVEVENDKSKENFLDQSYSKEFQYDTDNGKFKILNSKTCSKVNACVGCYSCLNNTTECENLFFLEWSSSGIGVNMYKYKMKSENIDSIIKTKLVEWYDDNIENKNKIVKANYCNNQKYDSVESGNKYTYVENCYIDGSCGDDTIECEDENKISSYVGLITLKEASLTIEDGKTYLNIGKPYWTMSPTSFRDGSAYVGIITAEGKLSEAKTSETFSVRPVITISDINVIGKGRFDVPYQYKAE